jgi:hypothetical protein
MLNQFLTNGPQRNPEVGGAATICLATDRIAGTIVAVTRSGKKIQVQEDHAKRTDKNGMSEDQTYEHTPNPNGRLWWFTQRKNGSWKMGPSRDASASLIIGRRMHYYDFSF